MQSEFPIRGKLFAASLVKKFLATNVRAEFFIKISSWASSVAADPRGVHRRRRSRLGSTLSLDFTHPLPPPVAEKFHIGTYGIEKNPHGSKYIPMGFLSDFIRSYPVTFPSILSSLIWEPSPRAWHASLSKSIVFLLPSLSLSLLKIANVSSSFIWK